MCTHVRAHEHVYDVCAEYGCKSTKVWECGGQTENNVGSQSLPCILARDRSPLLCTAVEGLADFQLLVVLCLYLILLKAGTGITDG